jgi:hypothetical protein
MRLFSIITTVSSTSSAERRKRQLTKASCAVKHRLSVRPNSTVTPSGVAHTVTLRRAWLKHEQRFFEWSLTAKLTGFKLNESDGRIISGSGQEWMQRIVATQAKPCTHAPCHVAAHNELRYTQFLASRLRRLQCYRWWRRLFAFEVSGSACLVCTMPP